MAPKQHTFKMQKQLWNLCFQHIYLDKVTHSLNHSITVIRAVASKSIVVALKTLQNWQRRAFYAFQNAGNKLVTEFWETESLPFPEFQYIKSISEFQYIKSIPFPEFQYTKSISDARRKYPANQNALCTTLANIKKSKCTLCNKCNGGFSHFCSSGNYSGKQRQESVLKGKG